MELSLNLQEFRDLNSALTFYLIDHYDLSGLTKASYNDRKASILKDANNINLTLSRSVVNAPVQISITNIKDD